MSTGSLPATADITIVGGGAMGCSLAYHLAARGRKPLLLERGRLGGGSTGRCAGGVRQQFSTAINIRLGQRAIQLLREFLATTGTDPLYRPIGYLLLATVGARAEALARDVALQRLLEVPVDVLGPAEVGRLVPGLLTDDIITASICASDGLAGPNEVTTGYAQAAGRQGAQVEEGVEVIGIDLRDEQVVGVRTDHGAVSTPEVVICAGPQSRQVGEMASITVPVDPLKRHVLLTEPFPGQPLHTPMTIDLATGFYFHPEGDGLLMGMGDPTQPIGEDLTVDWDFLPKVVEEGSRRLPALGQAALRTVWAGLYEMTPDRQPLVGMAPGRPGLWLACGFSGHGFMMAPPVGESLAAVICGASPQVELSPFSPLRFAGGRLVPESVFI
ncbi:MAG: NAD(P)/FAD-dependent oxidoreductase [Candidatus Dormibacteria bacterium]